VSELRSDFDRRVLSRRMSVSEAIRGSITRSTYREAVCWARASDADGMSSIRSVPGGSSRIGIRFRTSQGFVWTNPPVSSRGTAWREHLLPHLRTCGERPRDAERQMPREQTLAGGAYSGRCHAVSGCRYRWWAPSHLRGR
jgi:hypothetical protein